MKAVSPYLNFPGNTEEAFEFYRSVFGGDYMGVVRYGDFPDNVMGVPKDKLNKIANIALPLCGDSLLMGTDVFESHKPLVMGNNVYIHLETESVEEAKTLFDDLATGGTTEMPPQQTEWAELFGVCQDKFGVHWMVMCTGNVKFGE